MKTKYFELAKKLSKRSNHHQHKLGCVIVKKNSIVGIGVNQVKTHPKSIAAYNMLHAEISALIGLSYSDLKNSIAYVYREQKNGQLALARPCPSCMEALTLAGVKKVCYSDYDGYKELSLGEQE